MRACVFPVTRAADEIREYPHAKGGDELQHDGARHIGHAAQDAHDGLREQKADRNAA